MNATEFPAGLEQLGFGGTFKDKLCTMLEDTQIFRDLPRREVETLANYVHAYHAPAGLTLFQEGRRDSFMCVIVEGTLDILKATDTGELRCLAHIRPGKTLGEMSLIDELPHSATVVTTSEVILLLLSKNALQRLGEEYPRLAVQLVWRIAQQLSHRLRQTSGQLVDFL